MVRQRRLLGRRMLVGMDVAQRVQGEDEVGSAQVRLRPHFKRRVLIIAGAMLAVVVSACTWSVFGWAASQLPQDPGGPVYSVLGALGPFAGDDLDQARHVMTGAKTAEMLTRLRVIRDQLMTVKTTYELIAE